IFNRYSYEPGSSARIASRWMRCSVLNARLPPRLSLDTYWFGNLTRLVRHIQPFVPTGYHTDSLWLGHGVIGAKIAQILGESTVFRDGTAGMLMKIARVPAPERCPKARKVARPTAARR